MAILFSAIHALSDARAFFKQKPRAKPYFSSYTTFTEDKYHSMGYIGVPPPCIDQIEHN